MVDFSLSLPFRFKIKFFPVRCRCRYLTWKKHEIMNYSLVELGRKLSKVPRNISEQIFIAFKLFSSHMWRNVREYTLSWWRSKLNVLKILINSWITIPFVQDSTLQPRHCDWDVAHQSWKMEKCYLEKNAFEVWREAFLAFCDGCVSHIFLWFFLSD